MSSKTLRLLTQRFSFRRVSIRARLALLLLFIFGSTTILFSTVLFVSTIKTLQQDFDDALFNYCVDVSDSIEIDREGDLAFPPLRVDHGKILPFPLGTALIQVRNKKRVPVAQVGDFGTFTPPLEDDFARIQKGEEAIYRTVEARNDIPHAEAKSYRVISFPLDSATNPHYLLQIAVPMHLLETQIENRLYFLTFGTPLVLLIAGLMGFFVTGRALAPVNRMIHAAQSINVHDLSQRVPIPLPNDEIKHLGLTLNEMLDRIQKAFQSQERFVADASHQLLTPLTIMKGEMERALKGGSSDSEKDKVLQSSLQEVDHLSGIVKGMLLLARVDAGIDALNLQSLGLDDVVLEGIRRVEGLAKGREVKIVFNIQDHQMNRQVGFGDYDLLVHLVVILLENAIKYSPVGAQVKVDLEWLKTSSRLVVKDEGPGIPPEEREEVFLRFRRGPATQNATEGFGLGLAIAQKIAVLHGSQILLGSPPSGAEFQFEIKNI